MTIQTYKRIANLAFALGAIAVLCFDSFRNPLIPGLVLIGAGLTAGTLHLCARGRMHFDEGERTSGAPVGAPIAGDDRGALVSERERSSLQSTETFPTYQETHTPEFRALFVHRTQRIYFTAPPQPVGADLGAVETAIAVAKALSPEPTEYEVILTADGTLRIRPLSRIPEVQLFEEQRRNAVRAGRVISTESKLVQ